MFAFAFDENVFYLEEVVWGAAGDHGFSGAGARVELEARAREEKREGIMWSVKKGAEINGMLE